MFSSKCAGLLGFTLFHRILQPTGIEKAQGVGHDGKGDILAFDGLSVKIDNTVFRALNPELFCTEVADQVRVLGILPLLILADDGGYLKNIDWLDDQNVQQPIIRLRIGNRVEAATVPAAVADADHGLISGNALIIHFQNIRAGNPLKQVDYGGDHIGTPAGDQRQPSVTTDLRADTGVQAHGADVSGVAGLSIGLAANQVQMGLLTVQKPLQVGECLRMVKHFDKVIA